MKSKLAAFVLLLGAFALFTVSTPADARGGGRGTARTSTSGGGANRAGTQQRQASGANRSTANTNRSSSSSTSRNTSRSTSREVSRDVEIDVDDGCCFNGNVDNPLAATMVVAGTAAAIGSMVSQPPANCVPVAVNGMTYQQCGSTWYQPQMSGSSTTYVVVAPPQ